MNYILKCKLIKFFNVYGNYQGGLHVVNCYKYKNVFQ